jgi:hypothetical protein
MKQICSISHILPINKFLLKGIFKTLLFLFVLILSQAVFCQSGDIKGIVIDQKTGEAIPFANVVVLSDSTMIGGGITDFEGKYLIKSVAPGIYDLRISYLGYGTILETGIKIDDVATFSHDFMLDPKAIMLEEFEVNAYYIGLIVDCWTTGCRGISSHQCGSQYTKEESDKRLDCFSVFCCICGCPGITKQEIGIADEIKPGTDEAMGKEVLLKAYPNPSNGFVYLETNRIIDEMFLMDISGKLLRHIPARDKNKTRLEMYDLPNGMYLLKYKNGNHWDYVKLILSR